MMPFVLDTSAVLAILFREPGQDMVRTALREGSAISAVNLAEAITRLVRDGMAAEHAAAALSALPIELHDLGAELATATGALFAQTRPFGLSLGDRACLALARQEKLPALTGDRAWLQVASLVGVEVRLIR
jgi:PIN domain nuclease of toxin-antitoxin system